MEKQPPIQITADGLIVLRADELKMEAVGASDSYASWFVTEDGRRLAALASETDPVFAAFNLARYRWFSEQLESVVTTFSQFVVLGAGYDTRFLQLEAFKTGYSRVFEVDVASTLSIKRQVLQHHGVALPEWLKPIPCDLDDDDLRGALEHAGFQPTRASFIMAEGLFYYLNADTLLALMSPSGLGLAAGSVLQFDFWSNARIERLNERIFERRGKRLFKAFPFPKEVEDLKVALTDLGYKQIEITPLDALARRYWSPPHAWTEGDGWFLCKCEFAGD
ncbi:MAG TPA: class I SAM-dependent methyltransferase [Burkholderiales bacterium]|nr:class I SAM-dependent methyltransferase [Burkholderiales bacterium]